MTPEKIKCEIYRASPIQSGKVRTNMKERESQNILFSPHQEEPPFDSAMQEKDIVFYTAIRPATGEQVRSRVSTGAVDTLIAKGKLITTYFIKNDNCTSNFQSKEERDALMARMVAAPRCKFCGDFLDHLDWETHAEEQLESQTCSLCEFWQAHIKNSHKEESLRIDGCHYIVGKEISGPGVFRGFGGRFFKIQRTDTGRVFETTNLWTQGDIPEWFRKDLPDNARFMNDG